MFAKVSLKDGDAPPVPLRNCIGYPKTAAAWGNMRVVANCAKRFLLFRVDEFCDGAILQTVLFWRALNFFPIFPTEHLLLLVC